MSKYGSKTLRCITLGIQRNENEKFVVGSKDDAFSTKVPAGYLSGGL